MGRLRLKLAASVLFVLVTLGATIASGNEPVLGLDLQGGISVTLAPVGEVRPGSLDVAVDIIRNRVDSLGVAEPEISRQGDNIVVDLPGVKDRDKARRLVGRTAELRFRPVLALVAAEGSKASSGNTTTTTGATATSAGETTTTSAASDTTSTTAAAGDDAAKELIANCDTTVLSFPDIPTTSRADDQRDRCVVLPTRDGRTAARLFLDKTTMTGDLVTSADSEYRTGTGWAVVVRLGDEGAAKFNELAASSFPKASPQNQVAIVLDGIVQSSPAFQESNFPGGDVQITGDFTQTEAEDLAKLINYGALPVQLEEQTVQNVSPSLGKDQLRAGIIAGVIGLALVAAYMLVYYRLLGAVVVAGLVLSGAFLYVVVTFLGDAIGLALTLAGVTGIIVSVGVTVDSYVVYFERLKDEVRMGRTVRSSVDRGFKRSFRTIVAADLVSLIGALALYFLAIGSVRGFALFLGISTLLDLVVAYFFMHPLVSLMARRPNLVRNRRFGMAKGLDVPEAVA